MGQPRVGVQLIIYGERVQKDLPGVLAEIAEVGYDGVETGPLSRREDAEAMKAGLSAANLLHVGGHGGSGDWGNPETVTACIENVKAVGGGYLMASGGYDWKELDLWRKAAKTLNEVGGRCREAGLTFCYHNHNWEFEEIEGAKPIHLLMAETDPELVSLCPDVYWVHVGGEKPAEFIARYGARCPLFHFKDGLGGDEFRAFRPLGEGRVDLKAALEAALVCQPEWIVVEQDKLVHGTKEDNRISREYLRSLGV